MYDIQYESPRRVEHALELLAQGGHEAMPIAGGTNMVVYLRERVVAPRMLVDVSRIQDWRGISHADHRITLGPNCTVTDLLVHPGLRDGATLLGMAASWFAGPSIRNRATVAGNVADASPAADITVPLLALDAEVEVSRQGIPPKRVELQQFVQGPRKTILEPGDLITALAFSSIPEAELAYFKLGKRDSLAISIVSVALLLVIQSKRCTLARIALGAVAPVPFRATSAENVLLESPLNSSTAAQAGKLARAQAQPISDVRASAQYRSEMVEVLVTRMIEGIMHRRRQGK